MISKRIGKVLWCLDLFYTVLLLDFICFIPLKNDMKMHCLEKMDILWTFYQKVEIFISKNGFFH